jgi:hypothetical protein
MGRCTRTTTKHRGLTCQRSRGALHTPPCSRPQAYSLNRRHGGNVAWVRFPPSPPY